ncbi:MAG: hypothetical protein A2X61_13520 [Ignavibacteria bacterium GWB2_35_12]|nr:MAG: hypothetical protein A2X63_02970 [Ignavibacteria bacterium GWA2_35_8]OGU39876.1 MAG: hypothetical protein A2X61_13520 [Ignavibacteria bacterium GWB2_35_12]OGU86658.1 MAG: hypothetical protein A2220_13995 [Ignavibacteria bacterium RIFOXYA2_FULL_35_10]OGV21621.1 MAG: hypothetical protein A2475_13925 [Ignavibacteria bacterium RIFOXYC2_FULL_35_21]
MDLALQIISLIALVAFIVLTVYAVISLNSMRKLSDDAARSLNTMTRDINELKVKLIESLENLDNTAIQIGSSTQRLEEDVNSVTGIFKPFNKLATDVYNKISPPIIQSATIISAISKAINVFANVLVSKK